MDKLGNCSRSGPTVNAMSKPSALGADFYFPLIFALPLAFGCMAVLAKPLMSDD